MHFTGRTWRPPYEAHSVIIQATSGCTYNKCKFCNLYKNERFRMSPMEEFEEDLAEIKGCQPHARRIFWTGAFANTVSNFTPVTAYLPYDREKVTKELKYVLDNVDEIEMQEYRKNLKSLG